jgi:hypothetical protein
MTIMFDVLLRIARELDEDVWESVATGGNATTLSDTTNLEASDFWNGGTLFFKTGNRISTTAVITDFTVTTGVFTFATGAACAAGNEYMALTPAWSKSRLIQAVNTAFGNQTILTENEALTAASGTKVYTLPTGVSGIRRVQSGTDSAGWNSSNYWREEGGELRFYANEPATGSIRLYYEAKPTYASADSTAIDSQVDIDLLVWDALAELHLQRSQRSDENPRETARFQYYKGEAERCRSHVKKHRIDTRYPGGW